MSDKYRITASEGTAIDKYHITAKTGDHRIFRPKLQGHEWTDHEYYGKPCTVIQQGYVYDVHQIHIDGMPESATWWACGHELHPIG